MYRNLWDRRRLLWRHEFKARRPNRRAFSQFFGSARWVAQSVRRANAGECENGLGLLRTAIIAAGNLLSPG
jgi:hypothetical protein